jgi:hypothetical protein
MKRVSSAPGALSELGASQGPPSKTLGAHPQAFKTSSVLATGQTNKVYWHGQYARSFCHLHAFA